MAIKTYPGTAKRLEVHILQTDFAILCAAEKCVSPLGGHVTRYLVCQTAQKEPQ
jgi:hypothetical protein